MSKNINTHLERDFCKIIDFIEAIYQERIINFDHETTLLYIFKLLANVLAVELVKSIKENHREEFKKEIIRMIDSYLNAAKGEKLNVH